MNLTAIYKKLSVSIDSELIGSLTRENWIDFCKDQFLSEHLTDEYWGDLYENIDDTLILESFFSYPFTIQKTIVRQLRENRPVGTISAYVDLCNLTASKHKSLTNCLDMTCFEVVSSVEKTVGVLSREFFNVCEGITYCKDYRTQNPHAPGDMLEAIIYLMVALHGQSTVLEVLSSWEIHRGWADPCDLISLADNWSEMRVYPVDWALHLVREKTQ